MASVRDVLNHIGTPCTLEREGRSRGPFLASVRGETGLVEAKADPQRGEVLVRSSDGARFLVVETTAEMDGERVDHHRVRLRPVK